MAEGTCAICGAVGPLKRGWCTMHYQRWRAHGDALWEPVRRDPANYRGTSYLHEKTCPACGETFRGRTDQTHCSRRCGALGKSRPWARKPREANPNWRGDDVGYDGMHIRVRKERGKADHCERCGATDPAKRYDWASLIDRPRSINDFAPMCRSCHRKFDSERDRQRPGWQGTRNARRKLTADAVREARKLHVAGAAVASLAALYGVNAETMRKAVTGLSWTWVT